MRIIFYLLIFLTGVKVYSFTPEVRFNHYNIQNGLSHNTINSILQDSKGFIWFGTNFGLNRFDGSSIKSYLRNDHRNGLKNDIIYVIKEDTIQHTLWLGTDNGIVLFNLETEIFTPLEASTSNGIKISGDVKDFYLDRKGNVWIHNYPRCFKYQIKSKKLELVDFSLHNNHKTIPGCLWLDQNDILWLAYPNVGIGQYNSQKNKITLIGDHPHTPLEMYDYGKDSLLIGTLSQGLFLMNKKDGKAHKVLAENNLITDSLYINTIQRISNRQYWIGTLTGLYIMENGKIKDQIQHKWYDKRSISDQVILSICQDKDHNIWLGTETGGVDYYNQRSSLFKTIYPDLKSKFNLGQQVKALLSDKYNNLWIGMKDGGLGKLNISNGYQKESLSNIIPLLNRSHKVYALEETGDELWIGCFSEGVYVYNLHSKTIKHYHKTKNPGSLQNNEVYCIYADHKNRIWIGTNTDLYLFQRESETFKKISSISNIHIKAITEDPKGHIWLATANHGVIIYNAEKKTVKTLHYMPNNEASICYGALSDLFCDKQGNMWISSENGGLCCYFTATGKIKRITTKEGLPANIVYKILDGGKNALWISTNNGLVCIDTRNMKVLRTEYESTHLTEGSFITGSGVTGVDGTLYFGNANGIIAFDPRLLPHENNSFRVVITGISVFGQDISETDTLHRVTKKSIPYSSCIQLKYNESTFNISFSAMDYERENKGYYLYMLEGVDHKWIKSKNITEASYHGLAPGNYRFKIKYSPDGINWNGPLTEFEIIVSPPIWRTIWAYILYCIIILITAGIIWRRYMLKKKRHAYYEKLNWEREKKEEIYQAKINFFTNIAHEIRTPVTLIKAPVEHIMIQKDCPLHIKKDLTIIEKSVNRLHTMVNKLLEFRRIESDAYEIHLKPINVNLLIGIVADSFRLEAEKKGISLNIIHTQQETITWTDEDALTTIINNLIGNAVKYADTYVIISLHQESENKICIKIHNDGSLIPNHLRNHIFDPFVRNENSSAEGTGIGLALATALAKRLNMDLRLGPETHENVFELHLNLVTSSEQTEVNKQEQLSQQENHEQQMTANHKQTILLVDDYLDLSQYIADQLKESYNILYASNGAEALEQLQQHNIDLVVSDVMMPVMNGYELCQRIKNDIDTCHIPVILLTAKTLQENKIEGLENGADAYIDKPFSMEYLKSWIKGLLNNRQRIRHRINTEPVEEVAKTAFTPIDKEFANKLKELVMANIDEEDFNVDQLAEAMNMSRSKFHRKMKGLTGLTPGEFVLMIRLDYAAELLQRGEFRVNEVCSMVGFKSLSHFSRSFQKKFGVSPKNYGKPV